MGASSVGTLPDGLAPLGGRLEARLSANLPLVPPPPEPRGFVEVEVQAEPKGEARTPLRALNCAASNALLRLDLIRRGKKGVSGEGPCRVR